MSNSRYKSRTRNMPVKKSPSINKKIRKPLNSKENTIYASESRKSSLKVHESIKKYIHCEINEKSFLRSPRKSLRSSPRLASQSAKIIVSGKLLDSVKIDALSNFTNSDQISSSSLRQSKVYQPKGSVISDEKVSKLISEKSQKSLLELSAVISPLKQNKFLRKNKKQSNLTIYHSDNPKSKMSLNDIDSKITTRRTSEVPKDSLRLSNNMVLRSSPQDKKTSNDKLLSSGLGIKRIRKSKTATPKNHLPENTKEIILSSKLKESSVQKNRRKNSLLGDSEKLENDTNCKTPETVESFTSVRLSQTMTLQTRSSSKKPSRNRISPLIQNNSHCKDKRQSNLIIHDCENLKSKVFLNDVDSKMVTRKTSELLKDSLRLRNSMVLQSTPTDMLLSSGLKIKNTIGKSKTATSKNHLTENIKEINSLSSKLDEASVQGNKGRDSILGDNEKPENDIICKTPKAGELLTSKRSSRSSIRLQTRSISEKPSTKRVSLRIRHNSEKVSNNMLSNVLAHTANREQIKKCTVLLNKKNVKTTNKKVSLANQETEMLEHKHKKSDSTSKCSWKSINDKCLNNQDPQTPEIIPFESQISASSQKMKLTLISKENSEKTSNSDSRVKRQSINQAKVKEKRQSKKYALLSSGVKSKKSARKRPPVSALKTKTPIQKKRKLSVKFKKQARPRSYSATIPIDDLALTFTPTIARKTKSEGFKTPSGNSLKRKRFVMAEIKKADTGYEDDIYESKTFDHFKDIFPDSSDSSELSAPIRTPKLSSLLTPGIHAKTPAYRDCFSPTEYALNRKIAEEYMYRNRKKKRTSQVETPDVPERKKLEFNKVVEKACAIQKKVEKLTVESSDEEDLYFTEDI